MANLILKPFGNDQNRSKHESSVKFGFNSEDNNV